MTEVMISILVLRIGNLKKLQVAKGSSVQDVLSLINAPKDLYTGISINGAEQSKEAILRTAINLGCTFQYVARLLLSVVDIYGEYIKQIQTINSRVIFMLTM